MRFHVTDDRSGLRKTYYYDFEQNEVVGQPTDEDLPRLAVRSLVPRLCCSSALANAPDGCSWGNAGDGGDRAPDSRLPANS
jgi:hypothetical protein